MEILSSTKTLSFDDAVTLYKTGDPGNKAIALFFYNGTDLENGFVENFPKDWEDICWDTTDVNGNLIFNGIEELSADNYTFTFNCMIYDSNDENAKVIGSQTFTVNFTVTAEDLNQIKASQTSED